MRTLSSVLGAAFLLSVLHTTFAARVVGVESSGLYTKQYSASDVGVQQPVETQAAILTLQGDSFPVVDDAVVTYDASQGQVVSEPLVVDEALLESLDGLTAEDLEELLPTFYDAKRRKSSKHGHGGYHPNSIGHHGQVGHHGQFVQPGHHGQNVGHGIGSVIGGVASGIINQLQHGQHGSYPGGYYPGGNYPGGYRRPCRHRRDRGCYRPLSGHHHGHGGYHPSVPVHGHGGYRPGHSHGGYRPGVHTHGGYRPGHGHGRPSVHGHSGFQPLGHNHIQVGGGSHHHGGGYHRG